MPSNHRRREYAFLLLVLSFIAFLTTGRKCSGKLYTHQYMKNDQRVGWLQPQISRVLSVTTNDSPYTRVDDPYDSFTLFDKVLFGRFAASVAAEISENPSSSTDLSSKRVEVPRNYQQLMNLINVMTTTRSMSHVHDQGKNMLKRLFPDWLLEQYKWMFAAPFPTFSAWMNSWVTHWTTNWLMGNSTIYDLELPDGTIGKQQGLLVEKCRFLETAGCVQTCLHACKVPTQRFFLEEMGLPVTLRPNMTDFSCRFEFGVAPVPLTEDPIVTSPCLGGCPYSASRTGTETWTGAGPGTRTSRRIYKQIDTTDQPCLTLDIRVVD